MEIQVISEGGNTISDTYKSVASKIELKEKTVLKIHKLLCVVIISCFLKLTITCYVIRLVPGLRQHEPALWEVLFAWDSRPQKSCET